MNPSILGAMTLVVAVAVIGIAVRFGRDPAVEGASAVMQKVYGARRVYATILSVLLVMLAGMTLTRVTFAPQQADRTVKVSGAMWAWTMDGVSEPLPVGKRIAFDVTSTDVNHGFGIYDAAGHLLTQVQAMPGYTNTLYHTFDAPGTYHVLCMEFCGMVHHMMTTTFEVR